MGRTNRRRFCYTLEVWRFKPVLSASLRVYSHLSGGIWLRNYRAVAVFVRSCDVLSNQEPSKLVLLRFVINISSNVFVHSSLDVKTFCSLVPEWS